MKQKKQCYLYLLKPYFIFTNSCKNCDMINNFEQVING